VCTICGIVHRTRIRMKWTVPRPKSWGYWSFRCRAAVGLYISQSVTSPREDWKRTPSPENTTYKKQIEYNVRHENCSQPRSTGALISGELTVVRASRASGSAADGSIKYISYLIFSMNRAPILIIRPDLHERVIPVGVIILWRAEVDLYPGQPLMVD